MAWFRIRIVDVLLGLSLVTVVAQKVLNGVPQLFPGGALIGEVLENLATGYVGAWVFDLLVNRLPKSRDKRAVVSIIGVPVAQYAGQARRLLGDMARSADLPPVPRKPDRTILLKILKCTNPNSPSNVLRSANMGSGHLTWMEDVATTVLNSQHSLDRFVAAYPYLDARTVAAISAIDSTSLVRLISNYREWPSMSNSNMEVLEDTFWDYWVACSNLGDRYIEELFPLIDERKRLHIDSEEKVAAEGWALVRETKHL